MTGVQTCALPIYVETSLNDIGMDVSLTDDRAMGRAVSPFTDVRALTAYILELADEFR